MAERLHRHAAAVSDRDGDDGGGVGETGSDGMVAQTAAQDIESTSTWTAAVHARVDSPCTERSAARDVVSPEAGRDIQPPNQLRLKQTQDDVLSFI